MTLTGGDESAVHRGYYTWFLVALVGCFTPFKMLAYLLPTLFVVGVALHGGVSRNRVAVMVIIIGYAAIAYYIMVSELIVENYIVALITYSAFLPILVIDSRRIASKELLVKILRAASVMTLVQGIVGLIQAFYGSLETGAFSGANGDYVQGTIYPHLRAELAFSNPMFAVNMTMMLLACLYVPQIFTGARRPALFIGAAALVLASVMHALVFLVLSVLLSLLLIRARSPTHTTGRGRLVAMLALVCGLSYVALPDNVANISYVAGRAIDLDALDIPRAVLLNRVITELPTDEPVQPYIGLGPGQFSSRASLIMSGLYLGGPNNPKRLPLVTPQATRLATDYCISLLIDIAGKMEKGDRAVSSSEQPFFSFLSVYTETGGLGLGLVILLVARLILRLRRRARQEPGLRFQAFLVSTGTLFLLMLGAQDNYWEAPQAILIGLLLLKVMYANIMYARLPAEGQAGSVE